MKDKLLKLGFGILIFLLLVTMVTELIVRLWFLVPLLLITICLIYISVKLFNKNIW